MIDGGILRPGAVRFALAIAEPGPATRGRRHGRAEIGGEREQGPRHRLSSAVTRQEALVRDPARRHDLLLEQRQDHMSPAKHQRAAPVEAVEDFDAVLFRQFASDREQQDQPDERDRTGDAR